MLLRDVPLQPRTLRDYEGIAPAAQVDEARALAARLAGLRVLHVNSSATGGGVAELLRFLVPLLRDVGVDARWKVLEGEEAFFRTTKALHNGLQGGRAVVTPQMRETYLAHAREAAEELRGERYDLVVVHDPQPAALAGLRREVAPRWAWRCHIDASAPAGDAWETLRPLLGSYDAAVFTLPTFVPPGFPTIPASFVAPAIDPLSVKNLPIAPEDADAVVRGLGLDLDRPLVAQVSRFDAWKDPLGVIEAHRIVRETMPDAQLVLAGSSAPDDPEGRSMHEAVVARARTAPGVHVLVDLTDREVNALQARADVVVQKSLREGFGLVVSEALWKGTPVVGGRTGGIPLQVQDEESGILVDSVASCAAAVGSLLRDPARAAQLGERGRARVRDAFLAPRLLRDELRCMTAWLTPGASSA